MAEKNVNKWVIFVIGAIWCIACFFGIYFYCVGIMGLSFEGLPAFVQKYILLLIPPVALVFYFVFDKFILVGKMIIDRYLSRIIK